MLSGVNILSPGNCEILKSSEKEAVEAHLPDIDFIFIFVAFMI